jgi:hypothetical protein
MAQIKAFSGRHVLVKRLAAQVGDKGLAIALLEKRGDLKKDGKTLTAHGKKRDAMTAAERKKDRERHG